MPTDNKTEGGFFYRAQDGVYHGIEPKLAEIGFETGIIPENMHFETKGDCILRDAAIEALNEELKNTGRENTDAIRKYKEMIDDRIRSLPAADILPHIRGQWVHDGSHWRNRWICSVCGYKWFFDYDKINYCPRCGSDMRGSL